MSSADIWREYKLRQEIVLFSNIFQKKHIFSDIIGYWLSSFLHYSGDHKSWNFFHAPWCKSDSMRTKEIRKQICRLSGEWPEERQWTTYSMGWRKGLSSKHSGLTKWDMSCIDYWYSFVRRDTHSIRWWWEGQEVEGRSCNLIFGHTIKQVNNLLTFTIVVLLENR